MWLALKRCFSTDVARSTEMLFDNFGSLRLGCFSDSLTRSRNMLLSLRGSLTGLADPLIRLAPFWVLFPLRGSIFETALHWVWLAPGVCLSIHSVRSLFVLFKQSGSIRYQCFSLILN